MKQTRAREQQREATPDSRPAPSELAGIAEVPPDGPSPTRVAQLGQRSALVVISDAAIAAEHIRVALQVRSTHLGLRGSICPHTEWLLERARDFEDGIDEKLASLVLEHPAAHWFTRVKGTGGESIGKVLGHIEAFGRFYAVGDPMIPAFVTREPVMVPMPTDKPNEFVPTPMIWVEGIERLQTPSKLRKYAGLIKGQKAEAGKKLEFNRELRTMLWRLGTGFLRAQGKYASFYGDYKLRLTRRMVADGIKILPTPKGRMCVKCDIAVVMKAARFCPTCGSSLTTKDEPEGVRWQGHVHMMAMRRMIQLFTDHLWAVWREALGLPLRTPYPIEYLGHTTVITADDMCDRLAA